MGNTLYTIVDLKPEDPRKRAFDTYDILTLQDRHGVPYDLHFGFYQNGETFWFPVGNYKEFIQFVNKQSLPKGYDITDSNNIQDLIHTYEDSL